MGDELKPCPFCGDESPTLYNDNVRPDDGYRLVRCTAPRCGVETGWHSTEREAVTAWNTRAQGPGPGEAVALTSVLANACYLMSEPHLSGHRVILGFDTLDGATAAHVALSMAIIAATPTREA